ncbi:MAG: hypothetical protein EOO52_18270 [Gammaproteobacteria bacterium]|nr:MAG: hypothetical protein EOO52_18270 [Gammaproteobacteria bacterium]
MKRIICTFIGALFPLVAFSADISLPSQTISVIQTGWGGEGFFIKLNGGVQAPGCNSQMYLVPKLNNPMYNDLLSISLSAFHAKTKLSLRVKGCEMANDFSLNVIAISLSE